MQVELMFRLVLGAQTDSEVSCQYTQVTKKHFKTDYPLFHWLIIGYY